MSHSTVRIEPLQVVRLCSQRAQVSITPAVEHLTLHYQVANIKVPGHEQMQKLLTQKQEKVRFASSHDADAVTICRHCSHGVKGNSNCCLYFTFVVLSLLWPDRHDTDGVICAVPSPRLRAWNDLTPVYDHPASDVRSVATWKTPALQYHEVVKCDSPNTQLQIQVAMLILALMFCRVSCLWTRNANCIL